MLASIEQALTQTSIDGIEQDASKMILLLQAHDSNLFNYMQILKYDHVLVDFSGGVGGPEGGTLFSTTATLRFDLFLDDDDDDDGSYSVKAVYTVPSPTQQRNNEPLTTSNGENPPQIVELSSPYCNDMLYCPYEEFKRMVLDHISIDCIEEPLRTSLLQMQQQQQDREEDNAEEDTDKAETDNAVEDEDDDDDDEGGESSIVSINNEHGNCKVDNLNNIYYYLHNLQVGLLAITHTCLTQCAQV